jgi:hemerythrin-like domain-containing protein
MLGILRCDAPVHAFPGNPPMPSQRCKQLQKLALEHEEALAFADRIAELVRLGSDDHVSEAMQMVQDYYYDELEEHLQHEEQTLFAALLEHGKEHLPLCMQLGKEHGFLRTVVSSLRPETARQDLSAFAEVLRKHTEFEDERFFPLVESLFTPVQLERVFLFKPQGTLPKRPG